MPYQKIRFRTDLPIQCANCKEDIGDDAVLLVADDANINVHAEFKREGVEFFNQHIVICECCEEDYDDGYGGVW